MKRFLIGLIQIYQRFISPLNPSTCRFYPPCSQYSTEALLKYGAGKGLLLTLKRIGRCHPFSPGGHDPLK
jgi:putative membrane protein insertion efficiency factor